jgi:hypothetical protein
VASNGKWEIAFWVLTAVAISSFGWSTMCYRDNRLKIEGLNGKYDKLKEVSNDALHLINMHLQRIEIHLGIPQTLAFPKIHTEDATENE